MSEAGADGDKLAAIRKELGLSVLDAYQGMYGAVPEDDHRNVRNRWREFERGKRRVPPLLLRCAILTHDYAILRDGRLPEWITRTERPDE